MQPKIAQKAPYAVEVVAGQSYYWCSCGQSKKQPFCDGSHATAAFAASGATWAHIVDLDGAEADLRRALGIARNKQARTLELRAATGLTRAISDPVKRAEAFQRLESVLKHFPATSGLPDIVDARQVLNAR